jgi:hypothetical protein
VRDEARPFRVEVRLAAPVSLNHPWLHLDGILAHLAVNRVAGRAQYSRPTKAVQSYSARDLGPYAHALTRTPVAQGSISYFGPEEKLCSLQFFKRFEERGFPARRKIAMGFGHYRAWMLRVVYVPAEWAVFYGRGDVGLVRDLLDDLTHLGNKTRAGWGRVASVSVEEIEENRSLVWEGRAMRPLPVRILRRWSDALPMAAQAPYWDPSNVEMCAPPGAEVELMSAREARRVGAVAHG